MDEGPETYTVEEAARVLKRTPGRIRQMLRSGELSGEHEGGDERKPWRVHKWSAHALRDRLQEDRRPSERARPSGTPSRSPREPRESRGSAGELFRSPGDLQRELGRLEGRLEITETAESTLRRDLERERERAQEEAPAHEAGTVLMA